MSMTVPYICSACCHRIARQSLHSGKRQVARASSLATGIEGILTESTPVARPAQRGRYSRPSPRSSNETVQHASKQHGQDGQQRPMDDFTTYMATAANKTTNRYSRHVQPPPRTSPVDAESSAHRASRHVRAYTSELENILKQNNLQKAWSFFTEHYTDKDCPALKSPSLRDITKVRRGIVFQDLLSQATAEWRHSLQNPTEASHLPSPVKVMTRFQELGLAADHYYSKTLWIMSVALLNISLQDADTFRQTHLHNVQELMDLWNLCLGAESSNENHDLDITHTSARAFWKFVPAELLTQPRHRKQNIYFDHWFRLFVPSAKPELDLASHIADCAIATHHLLTNRLSSTSDLPGETPPFMDFATSMDLLLRHTVVGPKRVDLLADRLRRKGVEVTDETNKSLLQHLEKYVRDIAPAKQESKTPMPLTLDSASQTVVNRLNRAVERQDLDSVEKLWLQAQSLLGRHKDSSESDKSISVYEQFLMAFFRLRRPQSALHVWNIMIESGIHPTVRTWSVMMKGCHISRDVIVMETMWYRMRASGIHPDVQAWSTRIYGLMNAGKVQEGIRALDEMGREWKEAARRHDRSGVSKAAKKANPDVESVSAEAPKPDTAILNSALSALKYRGKQYIPNILGWSSSLGVEPDVITYNILLNASLAQGEQEEAIRIFQSMADANVEPDSATFTILLNSLFHSSILRGLDHTEQEERILSFIDSIESNGVSIDEKGYGIVVDRLLKEYQNLAAVQKVLARMASKQIEPTPHIYTILMTHYFDSSPPDLYAADALWNQIQSRSNNYGAVLDVIFYDRMVEGYARHGDVGRTMAFLTRMSKEGKRPGWLAMISVAKCLAEKEDWDRLGQIVLDCYRQEGLLSAGLRGTKGQVDFWDYVRELGVLNDLAIDV